MQVMCKYSRELFLSIYILFTCKHDLRIKRDKASSSPWTLYWENKTYKLKRAIDRPMAIWISESGKLLLVESGIQEFFSWNPESLALEFNDWNPKSMTWNPESSGWTPDSKTVLSCFFVWLLQFNSVLQRLEIASFRARTLDRAFLSFVNKMAIFMWLVRTTANMMDTRIKYHCIYRKGKK